MPTVAALLAAVSMTMGFQAAPSVVVVTTTADTTAADGVVSLREAIEIANADGTATTIEFNIPATDPGFNGTTWVIRPQTELPTLQVDDTAIEGFTQREFAGDTNPFGPEIELDGSEQPDGSGIVIGFAARNTLVRGLNVHSFPGTGIQLGTSGANSKNHVRNCYVGTDPTGATPMGNGAQGIAITGNGNTVAGSLISGNARTHTNAQVLISEQPGGGNALFFNRIGTDRTGTMALVPTDPDTGFAVSRAGIAMSDTGNNLITVNQIAGNATAILVGEPGLPASGNQITDNFIGTTLNGGPIAITAPQDPSMPYETAGIIVSGEGSDLNLIRGNTIAFLDLEGVLVSFGALGNTLSENLIFATTRLPIDLAAPGGCCGDGVTANDPDDGDAGPNDLQNFPEIHIALALRPFTLVVGRVPGAGAGAAVELYATEAGGHPSGHGGSMAHLGSVQTNGGGIFVARVGGSPSGTRITATATNLLGSTSEFGANVVVRGSGRQQP